MTATETDRALVRAAALRRLAELRREAHGAGYAEESERIRAEAMRLSLAISRVCPKR